VASSLSTDETNAWRSIQMRSKEADNGRGPNAVAGSLGQ
jgi:hypothetical protein